MTREQKIARARELREQGWTLEAIGDELGHSHGCIAKWLKPEWAKEQARKSNAKRTVAKREWADANDRKPCVRCGALKGYGAHRHRRGELCRACEIARRNSLRRQRCERIAEMWTAGGTLAEIADALSSTPAAIGVEMTAMRHEGWCLPYRYAKVRERHQQAAA